MGETCILLDAHGCLFHQCQEGVGGIGHIVELGMTVGKQCFAYGRRLLHGLANASFHLLLQLLVGLRNGISQVVDCLFHVNSHIIEAKVPETIPEAVGGAVELHS